MGRLVDIDKRLNVMSLYRAFWHFLKDYGFEISFYTPKDNYSYAYPDLCIKRGEHIYAAIYCDNEIEDNIRELSNTKEVLKKLGIQFIILQNSKESYKICDLSGNNGYGSFIVVDMDDIKDIFMHLENKEYKFEPNIGEKFKKEFLRIAKDIKDENENYWDEEYEEISKYGKETDFSCLVADDYGCYLKNIDVEDGIFYYLIDSVVDESCLCRYTSLNGLFRTLKDKKQSMCCLVSMNDASETNYVESYLGINNEEIPYNPQTENRFFILSLLSEEKEDDLTMWRLYGNDATGVCIEYTTDIDMLLSTDKLVLLKINYGRDKNHHPALDFLKRLLNVEIEGKKFKLRRLNEWKHFFKSYEYKDEDEIRYLYKSEKKETEIEWILTNGYSIITPIKLFDFNDFPLKITSIILGPNCPNKETNKIQIEQMIKDTGFPVVMPKNGHLVKLSNCITYRR